MTDRTPLSPFATDPDEELYAEITRLRDWSNHWEALAGKYHKDLQQCFVTINSLQAENAQLKKQLFETKLDTPRNLDHPAY